MRKYETYSQEKKLIVLVSALGWALTAPEAEKKATRDIYELAAKNGKIHGLVAPDFNLIKHETIANLITKIKP